MDALPCVAESRQMSCQAGGYAVRIVPRKSVNFAQLRWAVRAVQVEHGFAPRADDVNMCRMVIVRINCHPQPFEAQHRRHQENNKLSAWVFQLTIRGY